MRFLLACACATACVAPIAAQSKADTKPSTKPVTLSGCVARSGTAPDQYTLADSDVGTLYRLSGVKVADFLGKRVEIVGGSVASKRFTIAGGLTPSANAAAQAGAMDHSRAATEAASGAAAPGVVQLPEFRVKSVRPVSGNCPG